jgi:signal transduction histidine kinase
VGIHRVLLVEDEALDRLLLSGWLRRCLPDLVILEAASVGEAANLLQPGPVDAILLDLGLPDADGLPTLGRLLQLAPDTAIVVLSSQADRDLALLAVKQGAQDFLIKGQVQSELLLRSLQYATARKKQEQAQRALNAELVAKNHALHQSEQMRQRLVANASHELRNPLTAVRASIEALEMSATVPAPMQGFLESALRNVERLDALIADMLLLAQVELGHARLVCRPHHLQRLVQQALLSVGTAAQNRQICIESTISPDLPELLLDATKLIGVLDNLLSNAVKYSPRQTTIRLTAGLQVRQTGADLPQLEIRVADQGVGVKGATHAEIFEPFVRGDHSNTGIAGTGLGLSIVRDYVRLHGGQVWAEPNLPEGTVFVVQIPYVVAESA